LRQAGSSPRVIAMISAVVTPGSAAPRAVLSQCSNSRGEIPRLGRSSKRAPRKDIKRLLFGLRQLVHGGFDLNKRAMTSNDNVHTDANKAAIAASLALLRSSISLK
jgi:hypothetical protein